MPTILFTVTLDDGFAMSNIQSMKYILSLFLFALSASAVVKTKFSNSISFFSKETLSQPIPTLLCGPTQIQIPNSGTWPPNAITKIYTQSFSCKDIDAKVSVYFHSQNGIEYYSQQVALYVGKQLLSLCSGYFPISQDYLIPGACAGVSGSKLFGFSIIKK